MFNNSSDEARLHASLGRRSTQVRILIIRQYIARSSKGRTPPFEGENAGSIPAWVTIDAYVSQSVRGSVLYTER